LYMFQNFETAAGTGEGLISRCQEACFVAPQLSETLTLLPTKLIFYPRSSSEDA
jgi:hypothetical protein